MDSKRLPVNNPHLLMMILLPLLLLFTDTFSVAISNSEFDAIYQFGDSLSDTGNIFKENPNCPCSKPPYGETLPVSDSITRRCSDGLLIVDFLATAFNLPYLNPYLERTAVFNHGVNFAVAGSTALPPLILNMSMIVSTNSSLSVQLDWFRDHLNSICSSSSSYDYRRKKLENALFIMGEIGGNDFNYHVSVGTPIQDLYTLIPDVIQIIKDSVKEVIELGARHVVVPGNFPIGCTPLYLVLSGSNDPADYDDFNCLKTANEFAEVYNQQLREGIVELQSQYRRNSSSSSSSSSDVVITYADYYSAFRWVLRNAAALGFEEDGLLKACCGKGDNPYNCNPVYVCGSQEVLTYCQDPRKRISWDGLHFTEQAYKYIAKWILFDIFPNHHLPLGSLIDEYHHSSYSVVKDGYGYCSIK